MLGFVSLWGGGLGRDPMQLYARQTDEHMFVGKFREHSVVPNLITVPEFCPHLVCIISSSFSLNVLVLQQLLLRTWFLCSF